MTRTLALTAALVATAFVVPPFRARVVRLVERAGRGTTVRVVPGPGRR